MSKIAMVTGASDGIGNGVCRVLAQDGYDLMVHTGTNAQKAEMLCNELIEEFGIRAHWVQADLMDPNAPTKMFEAFDSYFDHLDLFVNNAGITEGTPFLQMDQNTFDRVVGINLRGAFFSTQQAALRMVEKGIKGNIILLSSNLREVIMSSSSIYGPVKSAVARLAKHESMELAQFGIRVNAIAPGCVDSSARMQAVRESTMRLIPLRKWATVEQIGKLVLYLVSEDGSFFTGSVIPMDGGASNVNDPEENFPQFLQEN